jgi:hypothetical protein
MPHSPLPTPDLRQRVHAALSAWYSPTTDDSPLVGLALVQQAQATGLSAQRATNQVLRAALAQLNEAAPDQAHLLTRRFIDEIPVHQVARELSRAEANVFSRQRRAIDALTALLVEMERQARSEPIARAEARLPWLESQQVFGLEPLLAQLLPLLTEPEQPHIVMLTGMGGVGKTTAARHALERIVHRSETPWEVGWVSAQQHSFHPGGGIRPTGAPALTADDLLMALAVQLLPAEARSVPLTRQHSLASLQAHLRQTPHVIVVDNLETLVDAAALLPTLRRLAGPSRFLLTSRRALPAEPDLYHLPTPELNQQDALALLRHEARMRNLAAVSSASDDDLSQIYITVGGNPLTLKLALSQLFLLPLPQVVDNLRQARGQTIVELYRYVYWQAWNQLDADGQEVLLTMPLFSQSGADLASIERVSEVKGGRLLQALERLAVLSLVNVAGDLWQKRFSIHRLTETFMMNEVIRWQGGAAGWEDELAEADAP